MAKDQTKRIRPQIIQEDNDAFAALKANTTYRPANNAYEVAAINAAKTAMTGAQEAESQAAAALASARDTAVAREWDYHNLMLGAKLQVRAQYGDDSDEAQSMGLKKKSERKSPARKATSKPAK